jgi:VanZ family protein
LPDHPTRPRLRAWAAVGAWAACISLLSSDWFSGAHTGGVLLPLLRALLPGATPELLQGLHAAIRKAAHVTEYLILALLLVRALRQEGLRGWRLVATAVTLGVAYAALDEIHQVFVPSRTASPGDVLVDAIGVVAGVGLAVAGRGVPADHATAPPADTRPVEN